MVLLAEIHLSALILLLMVAVEEVEVLTAINPAVLVEERLEQERMDQEATQQADFRQVPQMRMVFLAKVVVAAQTPTESLQNLEVVAEVAVLVVVELPEKLAEARCLAVLVVVLVVV
jgi:hypothetical protein